jgi:hypothetical protein
MPELSIANGYLSENEDYHGNKPSIREHPKTSISKRDSSSGNGILEFSPVNAGQDVTPANLDFNKKSKRQPSTTSSFQSLAGMRNVFDLFISWNRVKLINFFVVKDTLSQLAATAVKPICTTNDFKLLKNDIPHMSKEASVEV